MFHTFVLHFCRRPDLLLSSTLQHLLFARALLSTIPNHQFDSALCVDLSSIYLCLLRRSVFYNNGPTIQAAERSGAMCGLRTIEIVYASLLAYG